jgi:hypothetical protein
MHASDWLVPLGLALIGVLGVIFGARIAATSTLRSRLVDMMREDFRDQREFQIRAVAAVSELGTASALLILRRLDVLNETRANAIAALTKTEQTAPVQTFPGALSPAEDKRLTIATERWRSVLAEGHAFASDSTGQALRIFDEHRSSLVTIVNRATAETDLLQAIIGFELATESCDTLRSTHAVAIYRNLQIEKVSGTARIFHLAHVRRLSAFTKKLTTLYERQIEAALAETSELKSN